MTQNDQNGNRFSTLTNWIVGITGVLVAIPALINAVYDIYVYLNKLPRTEAEVINNELFKKHWGKEALAGGDVPVKTALGMVNLEFRIYEGGDIFTKYGSNSKWFRSPLKKTAAASLFIGSAHAQSLPPAGATGLPTAQHFKMIAPIQGKYTAEIVVPGLSKKETYKIDPRTGVWKSPTLQPYSGGSGGVGPGFQYHQFPTIDLTK